MDERFLLPDRFEGLHETAGKQDITKIILPVEYGINTIQDVYEEIDSSGRGSFLILLGNSGSGKTTFLRTLDLFIENVEILTISNEMDIKESINKLSESNFELRIIVIEGRESILDMSNVEVTVAIHAINSFIRSKKGRKSLVVWPCNNKDIVDNLVETSRTVGATSLLGLENTYFIFGGPDKGQYVHIAKQTVELLNNGKTLLDFGITDDMAQNFVDKADTIGEYLKIINSAVRKNKSFVRNLKIKEHCKMWVIVLGQNEPSKDVEALTKGEFLDADVQRLLVSTEANVVQDLKKIPDKIALLSNYLDTKIIYVPIVDTLSIVRNYANEELKGNMKSKGMSLIKDYKIAERLKNTELVRMIQMDTKLMGKKGTTGTNSIVAFGKLLEISETNDRLLNDAFGRALLDNGYIDEYSTEQNFGNGLTRRTDLLCKVNGNELRLEFMWRKNTSKAEIANYTLTKLNNYGRAIGFIE
jgi:DNA (cytosine-5)-methyltransferase 1